MHQYNPWCPVTEPDDETAIGLVPPGSLAGAPGRRKNSTPLSYIESHESNIDYELTIGSYLVLFVVQKCSAKAWFFWPQRWFMARQSHFWPLLHAACLKLIQVQRLDSRSSMASGQCREWLK